MNGTHLVYFRYYIDSPSVVVVGRPSAALAEKLEKDEKKRLATQVKKLGPEGLAAAEKELDAAKAERTSGRSGVETDEIVTRRFLGDGEEVGPAPSRLSSSLGIVSTVLLLLLLSEVK